MIEFVSVGIVQHRQCKIYVALLLDGRLPFSTAVSAISLFFSEMSFQAGNARRLERFEVLPMAIGLCGIATANRSATHYFGELLTLARDE
jgi:hypothetical protein